MIAAARAGADVVDVAVEVVEKVWHETQPQRLVLTIHFRLLV